MKRTTLAALCALTLLCGGCGSTHFPAEAVLSGDDLVLTSMTSPLSPFTFLAMGRQEEDGERIGIREVRVYDGKSLVQTLSVQEAIDSGGVDGILPGYTECPDAGQAISLRDMNFDGVPDVALYGWTPNNTIPHYYWLWDAEAEAYRYAFCLQGAEADPETETVTSQYKYENGVYYTDRYRYDETGALELAQREVEDWTRSGQDAPLREVYDVIDGELCLQE